LNTGKQSGLPRLAALLAQLDPVCREHHPDALLCFGDTDSTLAAGLCAVKLGIPLVHVEAGERSRDRNGNLIHPASAPEEANRVTVDHLSSLLLCATAEARENLAVELCAGEVVFTGDIMYDLFLRARAQLPALSEIASVQEVPTGEYILCTIHRALNTDNTDRLRILLQTLNEMDIPVLLPLHPRTRLRMDDAGLTLSPGSLRILPALRHHEILALLQGATWVVTDSGGLTREAYFSGVPSLCLDDATAWFSLTQSGWCTLTGADPEHIHAALKDRPTAPANPELFGNGDAARNVIQQVAAYLS
jgi:UDP-N-acetylglucosamine 2-epimerase